MTGFIALYVLVLAAFAGHEVVARAPVALHLPLLSGASFIHGIVLVGAMLTLGHADALLERIVGFVGVVLASANVVGGWLVTRRLLETSRSGGGRK